MPPYKATKDVQTPSPQSKSPSIHSVGFSITGDVLTGFGDSTSGFLDGDTDNSSSSTMTFGFLCLLPSTGATWKMFLYSALKRLLSDLRPLGFFASCATCLTSVSTVTWSLFNFNAAAVVWPSVFPTLFFVLCCRFSVFSTSCPLFLVGLIITSWLWWTAVLHKSTLNVLVYLGLFLGIINWMNRNV